MARSKNIRTSHQKGDVKRLRDDVAREFRRVESSSNESVGNIVAGAGLTGGGATNQTVSLAVRAADATINVSSSGISVNVGALDGVSLSNTTPNQISTSTGSSGTSPSASRSDHTHAHGNKLGGTLHAEVIASGAAGFMSGGDKAKLDGFASASAYVLRDGTTTLTGDWAVGSHNITGISALGASTSTFTGTTHDYTSTGVVMTLGSASAGGAPVLRLLKDDAQTSTLAFRNETQDRWSITCNASENLLINRLNSSGVLQDSITLANSTGLATFPASMTMLSAAPTLTIGDGTGAPLIVIDKADASNHFTNYNVAGTTRGSIAFSSNENFGFRLHDAGGTVAFATNYLTANGNWTFPAGISPQVANTQNVGDTTTYWASVITGTTMLRDGITAPAATANYATTYVDTADGMLKTIFADSAIATTAPGITCQSVVSPTRSTTDSQVVSSNAITVVFTGTVPQASMGLNGIVRVTFVGEYLNNDGAGRTLFVRLRFGGVTQWLNTSASIVNDADPRPFRLFYEICNQNSASVQACGGELRIGGAVPPTTGRGGSIAAPTADFANLAIVGANTTVATGTAARDVEIAIQHSASSANLSFTRRYAFLELIPT